MAPLTALLCGPGRFRARGFVLASLFSLALFAALMGDALLARQTARTAVDELEAREAIQTDLVRLDALLQSTALSAVVSGEPEGWAQTHERAETELARVFDRLQARTTSPELRSALEAARFARDIKTSIENTALATLIDGHTEEARAGLQDTEYHEQKHQFGHAMQHFEAAQLQDAIKGIRHADSRLEKSIFWATGFFAMFTIVWVLLLRASRQRERMREEEIEQRQRAQRALADSLSMYRSLFEASNDIVLLVSGDTGRIVDANERACTALGRTRVELTECNLSTVCDEGLAPPHSEEGEPTHLRRRNGTRIPVVLRRRSVQVGDEEYLQVAARDMSTCRSLEAQLHHSQRLESVGQLACGIAHEFSNLALVLSGQASLMRETIRRARPIGDSLDRIEGVAAEARRISRSLMCFSGHARPDRHPVDVRAVARSTVDLLVHVMPPGIQLETDGITGEPLVAMCDEGEIEQILLNLALNARDAMPSGGTLWLSCESSPGGEMKLVVGDTGCGIEEDELDRIFEPLYTTKPPGSSTGLGLSIVDRIVRQLDGQIRVRTRPGQGTSFTVTLPLLDSVGEILDGTQFASCAERSMSIRLAVENPAARSLLRTEFESRGHRVVETELGPVDLAIVIGRGPAGPAGELARQMDAGHVIRLATNADLPEDQEEDGVVVVGPSVPLEELVRIAEGIARLRTGEHT